MDLTTADPYAPPAASTASSAPRRVPPVSELFRDAWASFHAQRGALVLAHLAASVLSLGLPFVLGQALDPIVSRGGSTAGLLAIANLAFGAAWGAFVSIGAARLSLDAARGVRISFRTLVSGIDVLVPAFVVGVVETVLAFVGFFAFVVPCVIVTLGLSQASWLVADRAEPAGDALSRSWAMTRGVRAWLFGFELACAAVMIVGALALGVGILIAIPLVSLARAHVYLVLSGQSRPVD